MAWLRLWTAVTLALSLFSSSLPALAQDEAKKTEARERFFRGLQLAENDDWENALKEFEQSLDLYPTRVAVKNAAVTLQQLRRFVDARAMYKRMLSAYGSELSAEERQTVEKSLAELEKRIATVVVRSQPSGAKVVIDGRSLGQTPVTLPVDAGNHWLRLFKEGYAAYEAPLDLAGGRQETVDASLARLTRSGRLRVAEAGGVAIEVLIDGVPVGKTPWEGSVEAGSRSVILRGPGQLGTPPSTATVFEGRLSVLTLKVATLDAEVRIVPVPSNALVHVDGVPVGSGVWDGRLPSGNHVLEATAPGFLSTRREVRLTRTDKSEIKLELERDPSDPRWRDNIWRPHPYVELTGGAFLSPGFAGSASRACSRGECSDHAIPIGFLVGARGGYQLTGGLGVELFIGLLSAKESMTRSQTLTGEADFGRSTSKNFEDSTKIFGPAAALSASYRLLEKTPLTFRAWLGVARVNAKHETRGDFSGTASDPATGETAAFTMNRVEIDEDDKQLWLPFAGPEVRFGYRVSPRLSFDVGAAFLVFLGPDRVRSGGRLGRGETRADFVGSANGTFPSGAPVGAPGRVELPRESSFGTFFAVVPTLGGRFEL
jgi:hypothetical protein